MSGIADHGETASPLIRVPAGSPDHFVCKCGYWCLNSPCPKCEEPQKRARMIGAA